MALFSTLSDSNSSIALHLYRPAQGVCRSLEPHLRVFPPPPRPGHLALKLCLHTGEFIGSPNDDTGALTHIYDPQGSPDFRLL